MHRLPPSSTRTGLRFPYSTLFRFGLDVGSRPAVLLLGGSGVLWLVIGSAFGLMASLKLYLPDLLTEQAFFTFGRARTVHLNLVAYGGLSMTGIAVAMWMAQRIIHTPLSLPRLTLESGSDHAQVRDWQYGKISGGC